MNNIAFLGMGAMGQRCATHLLAAGYSLHVWNRTSERCQSLVAQGAMAYATPKQAAAAAEVVMAMVADDQASRQVWLDEMTGAMGGLQQGAIALEYSTLTPGWCQTLATVMCDRNHPFLAAPVVGSRPQKDFRYAQILAQTANACIPTIDAVHTIYQQAQQASYGTNNIAGIAQLYQ